MSELTDLQICKRIAEIEVEEVTVRFDWDDNLRTQLSYGSEFEDRMPEYNPLTDDSLLNQLIFKYEISISFNFCLISMITNKQYEMNFTDIPSLKRNCLLLIIEAHKDQS